MHVEEEDVVSENSTSVQVAHNLSIDNKPHGRLSIDQLEDISQKMETDAPFQTDCSNIGDNHHYASDTLNQMQVFLDSAPVILEKDNLNQIEKLTASNNVISEELMTHPEVICSLNTNSSSEKNDFDSVGQDMVKSMMTFLLPQAIPLLKKTSGKKKTTTSTSETLPCDGNAKDILLMENEDRGSKENMHTQHVDCKSIVPSLELVKSVVFDSLEDEQYCDHANISGSLSSTIADNGLTSAKEDSKPIKSGQQVCGSMHDESLVYHDEITGRKKSCNDKSGDNLHGTCPEGNLHVSTFLPSCISSGRDPYDESVHHNTRMDDFPLNLPVSYSKMDFKTTQDYTEHDCQEQACSTGSFAQLSRGVKEIISKKEVAGNDIFPSSQIPRIVYSRRKTQHASHLARERNHPCYETCTTSCVGRHVDAQTSLPTKSLQVSNINPMNFLPENQQIEDSVSAPTLGKHSTAICSEKTTTISEAEFEKRGHCSSTLDHDEALLRVNNNEDNSGLLDQPWREQFEACVVKEMIEQNNLLRPINYKLSHKTKTAFSDNGMDFYPHSNVELYHEAQGVSKTVGCYLHHLPVLSVFLRNIENAIYICVLCGLPVDKNRKNFTYRVEVKEPRVGYPSFVGYTTVMLPVLKDYLGREIALEKTGFQWTPDGSYLVLIGSITTPFCRIVDGRPYLCPELFCYHSAASNA